MSNILWIEDFESDPTQATEALFKEEFRKNGVHLEYGEHTELLRRELHQHGIFLELTFWRGWKFITNDSLRETIEFVVLDIDLNPGVRIRPDEMDEFEGLLYRFGYWDGNDDDRGKAIAKLKRVAGYHLYIELIHTLGFPKDNILICSNHADILSSFENSFEQAKIDKPRQFKKSEEKELQKVIAGWRENSYYVLRRGILDGCSELKNKKGAINKFITVDDQLDADYLKEYLNSLELFLPLRQPKIKALLTRYKLFIRTLVHECDLINWNETNLHGDHKPLILKKNT